MSETPMGHHRVAATLVEALPYMRRFKGDTFVVKFGGHAMAWPPNLTTKVSPLKRRM